MGVGRQGRGWWPLPPAGALRAEIEEASGPLVFGPNGAQVGQSLTDYIEVLRDSGVARPASSTRAYGAERALAPPFDR